MSGPYRSPDLREDEEAARPERVDLGARKSAHSRSGARGAVAVVMGGWPEVDVHEHGLVFRGVVAGRREIPFEEIDAIHYDCDGLLPGPPRIDLVTFDGVRTSIPSDLHDLDRVIEAIDREVTTPLTTRAKDALARGEQLLFGPLVLELDGIVLRGERLSWSGLSQVVAERDSLVFHASGPGRFGWTRLVDIPHPRALLEVLRMRTRVVVHGLRLRAGSE